MFIYKTFGVFEFGASISNIMPIVSIAFFCDCDLHEAEFGREKGKKKNGNAFCIYVRLFFSNFNFDAFDERGCLDAVTVNNILCM